MKLFSFKIAIFIFLLFNSLIISAQKSKVSFQEKAFLEGGTKMPSVVITDIQNGNKYNLSNLGELKLKYPDRPTLVLFWSDVYCNICVKKIDEILSTEIDKDFNVVIVNVDDINSKSNIELEKSISNRSNWNRLKNYRLDASQYQSTFNTTSVPYWFVLNNEQKIMDAFLTYQVSMSTLKTVLEAAKIKQGGPSKIYLNTEWDTKTGVVGDSRLSVESSANSYIKIEQNDNNSVIKLYTIKDALLKEYQYKKINNEWLYNDLCKDFYINGKVNNEIMFKDGRLNGYLKQYNLNGQVKSIGYYSDDNLQESIKTEYMNGLAIKETISKTGEKNVVKVNNENVASVKSVISERLMKYNKLINDKYQFVAEGLCYFDSDDKLLSLVKWEDLTEISGEIDGFSYKGNQAIYSSNQSNANNSIRFKNNVFYFDKSYNKFKEFFVLVKGDFDDFENIEKLLKAIQYLSKLK